MSKLLFAAAFAAVIGLSAFGFTSQASAAVMGYDQPIAKQGAPIVIEDNTIIDRQKRKRKRKHTGTDDPQPHS